MLSKRRRGCLKILYIKLIAEEKFSIAQLDKCLGKVRRTKSAKKKRLEKKHVFVL